jgi:translation initiation factor 2 alpha subunit (eIF-2alpha)
MSREIKFESALPDDIDKRMEKIQVRLEELNPEIWKMVEELEQIGWDLEGYYKDLYQSSNNAIQSQKYELEKITSFSNWIKNFRVNPH